MSLELSSAIVRFQGYCQYYPILTRLVADDPRASAILGHRGSAGSITATPSKNKKDRPPKGPIDATKCHGAWPILRTCKSRRPGRTAPPRRLDPASCTP